MAAKKLMLRWLKKEDDHVVDCPSSMRHGRMIMDAIFNARYDDHGVHKPSIAEVLEDAGYDLSTLRFECSLKATTPAEADNNSPEVGA